MTERSDQNTPNFFLTAPQPCPYLSDHYERKVFTYLTGTFAQQMNTVLTQGGFRRSQNVAYRPVCDGCQACVSVRIVVDEFEPDRSMKRVLKKNTQLVGTALGPAATDEQYSLFSRYLHTRHANAGMDDMTFDDYKMMIEDTHVDTHVIEYRTANNEANRINSAKNDLIAVALTDVVNDGLSMVYSFYDPDKKNSSLGVFLILDHIRRAKRLKLPYVYLGYWVEGSQKMDYKSRYQPQEHLTPNGWKAITR